uniref:Uncharacterized protein n=1 Tax=Arundo donax TaxID=35708 RepID=A0A0A9ENW6_ARUDO
MPNAKSAPAFNSIRDVLALALSYFQLSKLLSLFCKQ